MLQHTRIGDPERLAACLSRINGALRRLREDPAQTLFMFDTMGHCFVHETTYRSIHRLWQSFVAAQADRPTAPAIPA
jgi:hypothetical protein